MSREFKSSDVEELIKQAFRLAPEYFFRGTTEDKIDIEQAIDFVRMAADNINSGALLNSDDDPPVSDHYSRLLVSIVGARMAANPHMPAVHVIGVVKDELERAGVKP